MLLKVTADRVLIAVAFHMIAMLFAAVGARVCSEVRSGSVRALRRGNPRIVPMGVDPAELRRAFGDASETLSSFCVTCPRRETCSAPLE
ncbi:MAG: hypothetical protein KA105_02620 [Caulobacter sp.]|nr:hypothetical protein [Caulobacter sp.]